MRLLQPRWLLYCLLCLLSWVVLPLRAQQFQAVPYPSGAPVELTVQWCATAAEVDLSGLLFQDCDWRPLDVSKVVRGWDERAYWLRLSFHNPLPYPVERWLELGHPQMARISLYLMHSLDWQVSQIGDHTPMSERGIIERTYGVLPIEVPANARYTAWVRLSSDTMISLYTAMWEPNKFRKVHQIRQFWISLGIGGMGLVFVFSMMMWVLTRQIAYGFFALGQVGLFLGVSSTGGVFQRLFWLENLPHA